MNINIPIPEFLCHWPFYVGIVVGLVIGLLIGATVLFWLIANLVGPFK